LREVYYRASRQSKTLGPVDCLIADEATYHNYLEDLDDQVRVQEISKGDKSTLKLKPGVPFGSEGAVMYLEDALDPAAAAFTTPAAADGICYMLRSASWYTYTLGHDSGKETKGDFAVRGPFRLPEQDMWRYELVLMMGLHTNQLRANGVVTGGGTP
jgi:hypothetical protein